MSMTKRKEKVSREKKRFTTKKLAMLSLFFTFLIISTFLLFHFFFWTSAIKFSFKAAVVDQLESAFENKNFVGNVTQILQQYNFTVVHNRSTEITVNFYRNLPKYNLGIIILRVHSAIRNNTNFVDFFTSERYQEGLYGEYGDALSVAWLPWESAEKKYFAIGPKFVGFMEGTFPKSIVIAMGCNSLSGTTMAQAFIDRGARLYIGWTGSVSINDSDNATLKLLGLLFVHNKTINDAVNQCNNSFRFEYPGHLDYFPKGEGVDDRNIWDLVLDSNSKSSSFLELEGLKSYGRLFVMFGNNVVKVQSKRVSRVF
jgi:hypothetical protein